ncbi:emp24/gp25L/p24 family/GOLD-domain-containing protein [Hyaloraphidium curvatum]|nr:emp24/gp25L/p24 family/GOLD-domain-containing protein [Hyaloraphidium curvatum]
MQPRRPARRPAAGAALALLLLAALPLASAVTLTYKMQPNENACFYVNAVKADEKIAFYYAVQSGGSFDLDYTVTGPDGKEVISGSKERQGDFVFSAPVIGEYSFCFSNVMSTFAEKLVDFDITVEHDLDKSKGGKGGEEDTKLTEALDRVGNGMANIVRNQKYFRTRQNRNESTVVSTSERIFWFNGIIAFLIVAMSAVQVGVIRMFFRAPKTKI